MFDKFKKIVVVSMMMVLLSACSDDGKGSDNLTPPNPPVDPGTPPILDPSLPKWDGSTVEEIIPNGDVYEISNPNQLAWVASITAGKKNNKTLPQDFMGKTLKFMNDINMDDKPFPGLVWFSGKLEGNGKSIHNLKIGDGTKNGSAFIVKLRLNGSIDNLTIASGHIHGKKYAAGLVGEVIGKNNITNSRNYAKIEGEGIVSGIVASLAYDQSYHTEKFVHLTIKNTKNYGEVISTGVFDGLLDNGNYVAGLVGRVSYAGAKDNEFLTLTIDNSSNNGSISGKNHYIAGIVGNIDAYDAVVTIRNTKNVGNITGAEDYSHSVSGIVGNIKGMRSSLTISNTSNSGIIKGKDFVGGFVGDTHSGVYTADGNIAIDNSSNVGAISGNRFVGGIIGSSSAFTLAISHTKNSGIITGKSTDIGGISGSIPGGAALSGGSDMKIFIDNSSNSGAIIGDPINSSSIGGIVGTAGGLLYRGTITVINSYNSDNLSGESTIGGIAGVITSGGTVNIINVHSYATTITASATSFPCVGGIIAKDFITQLVITNSYWLKNDTAEKAICDASTVIKGASVLTETEFKVNDNFNDWKFGTIWELINSKYPTLKTAVTN